ncbi:hypothetical protein PIB30_092206 [Stylosanthes scabra]|uniref:Uncharacterized protein n=1 Tax=Stylosanthes scabra TaxID=79078 RepID=A0ABU6TU66_9FABA|nr:hypothetical protein [Stylosanthes scabra]
MEQRKPSKLASSNQQVFAWWDGMARRGKVKLKKKERNRGRRKQETEEEESRKQRKPGIKETESTPWVCMVTFGSLSKCEQNVTHSKTWPDSLQDPLAMFGPRLDVG